MGFDQDYILAKKSGAPLQPALPQTVTIWLPCVPKPTLWGSALPQTQTVMASEGILQPPASTHNPTSFCCITQRKAEDIDKKTHFSLPSWSLTALTT